MYSFIELLRALAAMLITNSHFDGVYPWNISWGGCPGVSLFFVISGFVLAKSVYKEKFFLWWLKKVIRLYISLSIVNIITVLIGFRRASVGLFLFPININLWYVPAITVLYILYYFVLRKMNRGGRVFAIVVAGIVYSVAYCVRYRNEFFVEPEVGFRVLYGFIAMMIGSMIYDHKNDATLKSKRVIWLCLGVASCGGFLIIKLLLDRVQILMQFQFMTQVSGVAFAVFMILAGLGYETGIQRFMKTWPGRVVELISTCSLEVYLVQFAIINYMKGIVFPINLILIVALVLLSAYIVHRASRIIYNAISVGKK